MTAPLLTSSSEPLSPSPVLRYRSNAAIGNSAHRSTGKLAARRRNRIAHHHTAELADLSALWGQVLELLPQGVMVVSRTFKPVYWNQKAKNFCAMLVAPTYSETTLPLVISELCHRLLRETSGQNASIVLEYETPTGRLMRLSACWLEQALPTEGYPASPQERGQEDARTARSFIAVFLENCDETLRDEMYLQQKKYDLTDREAEISMLLRRELTYQEIAQTLQISLNTVKTHVKNIYAKRRSCQGKDKFWCRR